MRFADAISRHGTEAVQAYRTMSGIEHDNELPEAFLGSWIALALHREFQVNAHIESSFTGMARRLGQPDDPGLTEAMGGRRGDIAIFEAGNPTAVIEIKIHDEGGQKGRVQQDLARMRELARRTGIETYLGVLITDTTRSKLAGRREKLEAVLERPADVQGTPVRAGGGNSDWEWCFACWAFPPQPAPG